MATYDLRVLLETVQGEKTSYISSSFVDTDVELVLSSSQVYHRITGSVSCSFLNDDDFTDGTVDTNYVFKDNSILSASLNGGVITGSISFTAKTDEYDRLLRYKFIGDKVCTVMGLPSNQWIYVDQLRLPADDESNILKGNMNIGNAFVSDTLTFANNANVNSDIPFYIDTGSDRYIKFIDTRDEGKVSLIFGYDKDTDTYEINAATGSVFNIKNLNNLDVDTVNAAIVNQVTSSTQTSLATSFQNMIVTGSLLVSGSDAQYPLLSISGDISASGNIITTGDVIAENYIVKSTVTQITQSFSSGSTIFGDTPADDTHQFTGSVSISGSGNDLIVMGNISGSGISTGSFGAGFFDNKVGIGIKSPSYPLHVKGGRILVDGDGSNSMISLQNASGNRFANILNTGGDSDSTIAFQVGEAGSPTEAMIIHEDGRVGIGASSPASLLHVDEGDIRIDTAAGGTQALRFSETSTTKAQVQYRSGDEELNLITVDASGTAQKRITIKSEQDATNVGIGTASPSHELHIKPSSGNSQLKIESDANHAELLIDAHTGYDPNVEFQEAGVAKWVVGVDTSNGDLFQIGTSSIVPNDNKFVINTSGQVGIGTTSPTTALQVEGKISSSDDLKVSDGSNTMTYDVSQNDLNFNGSSFKLFSNAHDLVIETDNFSNAIVIDDSTQKIGIGTSKPTVALQVVGDISASGVIFARRFESSGSGEAIDFVDNINVTGDITASGDISSSSDLYVSQSVINTHTIAPGMALTVEGTISSSGVLKADTGISSSNATFTGDIDVDGTSNLDAVDIDGAVQIDGTTTFGVDGTGVDVKLFGNTSGQFVLWDQSEDELALVGDTKLSFHDAAGGENIVASSDGHLEINAGTTLDITAPTVDINTSTELQVDAAIIDLNASGVFTLDGASTVSIDAADNTNITVGGSGKTLDIDASGALTIDSATSIGIGTNADKPIDIDSTTLDIDASDAITIDGTSTVSIDGADDMNFTITSDGAGKDLTIQQIGANDSSIIITAAGTGADAVSIDASAGSMLIAPNLINGKTLTIGPSSATQMVFTPHGTAANEKISLINTSGTADDAIKIDAVAGGLTLAAGNDSLIIDADGTDGDALNIDSAGGIDVDAAGLVAIDSVGLSIDNAGTAANITNTSDGNAEDFTIALAGATNSSLILSSTGTGADALQITTTAGGIDITTTGAAADEDIDISTDASVNVTSTEDAANAIYLRANAGTSETIKIHSDQGSGEGSIEITSDAGGIDLNAAATKDITLDGGQLLLTSAHDVANSIYLRANAGTSETIKIHADQGTGAGSIELTSDAGGIDINSADDVTIDAADEISLTTTSADGHISLVSAHEAGQAIHLDGDADAGSIVDIDAGILDIDVTGATSIDAGGALNITTTGAASDIAIVTAHTAGTALHIDANANAGSVVDIDAGILDIDVTGATSIDAGGALNITTTGAASDISVVTAHTAGVALHIDANANAGSIVDIDAGILDIDVTGAATLDAAGVAIGAGSAELDLTTTGTLDINANALDMDLTDSSAITLTSSEGAEDLTIEQVGGNDSSIIITAEGTGDDAIKIDATAGSMLIAPSLANGKTLKIGPTSATEMVFTPHGTAANEKISLINTSGTADDAIKIDAVAGGLTLAAGNDSLIIDADGTDADALNIDSAGGIDVDAAAGITIDSADDTTITVGGTGKILDIDASGALTIDSATSIAIGANADKPIDIDSTTLDIDSSDAITIDGTSTISIDGADDMNFTITSDGAGKDLTIAQVGANDSSIIITAAGTGTDAIKIDATAGDMLIAPTLIDGKTLKLGPNGATEMVFTPSSTAGDEKILLTNTAGTADDAIKLHSVAGGITLLAANDSLHIDADGTDADALNIDSAGGVDVDAAGLVAIDSVGLSIDNAGEAANITSTTDGNAEDFTIALAGATDSSLILSSAGTGADALQITTTAGGIDITNGGASGGEDIDITSTNASVIITAGEAVEGAILLHADGGANETISIHSDQGTGVNAATGTTDASINLISDVGGIGLNSGINGANAIRLEANGGVNETIVIHSNQGTGAGSIELLSDVGGITLTGDTDHGVLVGTVSGAPISIGHTTSETTVNDNLTVTGDIDANGDVDIAGDLTLSAGADGALTFGAASSVKVVDNNAAALVFEEANNAYITLVTSNDAEKVLFSKDAEFLGEISASGNIITTGDIIAENYIVRSSVTQITSSFSSGSTIFGDTPGDGGGGDGAIGDIHQFTGSVSISGSNATINVGNVDIDSVDNVTIDAVDDISLTTTSTDGLISFVSAHTSGDAVHIDANANAGSILNIDAGILDLDTDGKLEIDSVGAASHILHTATADGDFTIGMDGNADASLILSSTGTAADALQIATSAGGMDITVNGAAAGEDLDITADSSINITATEDAANAIYLRANGGTSETLKIHSDQGTGEGSIEITSDAGGIDLNAAATKDITLDGGQLLLTSAHNVANAIYLRANAGTTETIKIHADQGNAEGSIELTSDAGGIDLNAHAGKDITLDGGQLLLTSAHNVANSILLHANAGTSETIKIHSDQGTDEASIEITSDAGGIDLNAAAGKDITLDGGQLLLTSAHDVANSIYLRANAGTSETIKIHSDQGTGAGSIELTSDAGGIDINSADDVTIDAADEISLTTTDTGADGKISLVSGVAGDNTAIHLDGNANAASIVDIDAGVLDIDVTGAATLDAAGVAIGAGSAELDLTTTGTLDINANALDMDLTDSSAITVTSNTAGEDLTIEQVGGNDSSIIITAAGTGTDAIKIDATAGSMLIAPNLTDGKTLKIGPASATQLVFTPSGTAGNEKISLTNTSGDDTDAIEIISSAGGIRLNANSAVSVGGAGDAAGSLFNVGGGQLTTGHLINITGSNIGELHFSNSDLGGSTFGDSTGSYDEITGSSIGVIAFSGRTEYQQGAAYKPTAEGDHEAIRLLAHIRAGADIDYILDPKEIHGTDAETFSYTGGFLSFHTAEDSRSYDNVGLSDNESMRIDRFGRVGIGRSEMDHKLVVDDRMAITSSFFNAFDLGPSLTLKGLRSSSAGTEAGGPELPFFILTQAKSQHGTSGTDESSSFEIRARKANNSGREDGKDAPLDFGGDGAAGGDLVAMHIRTYGNSNIGTINEHYETGFDAFESIPHKGANFGFNMNNPDGFNINTQQTTFGLGFSSEFTPNRINFRGHTQFRSEEPLYESEDLGQPQFGGQEDFEDYMYDNDPPEDDPGLGDFDEDIQVNPPDNDFILWRNPNQENLDSNGNFEEIPLSWQWSFNDEISSQITSENLRYAATGSVVSGAAINPNDNTLFNQSQSCWTASFSTTGDENQYNPFFYVLETNGFTWRGNFNSQQSASAIPSNQFPTFPTDGDFMVNGEVYKWKIELNKLSGPESAPAKIEATSSARFTFNDSFTESFLGDINQDTITNIQDVVMVINHVIGSSNLTGQSLINADMNQDQIINVLDIVILVNNILGVNQASLETGGSRGYNTNANRVFKERQIEQSILVNLRNELSSSNVDVRTNNVGSGSESAISSSLRSFVTSSINYIQSGSRLTSFSNPYDKRIKPKIETGYGYDYIESITGSKNNLAGVVEGSTLLFNNSLVRNVEEVFITSSTDLGTNRTLWVKLDSALPSGSISGSFYKQFKPKGIGLSKTPVFINRGKTLRKDKGILLRPDGKVGIGTAKPQAILHISASDTGSGGVINDTLFKIEKPDGSEYKVTDSEIKYQDKQGFVSRRKFNKRGQEVLISGSKDTAESENNTITFDQTGDGGIITLSGSARNRSIIQFTSPNYLKSIKDTNELITSIDASRQFHSTYITSSGKYHIGPTGAVNFSKGIVIGPDDGQIGIRSDIVDEMALSVGGHISASGFLFLTETGSAFQGGDITSSAFLFASSSGQLCYQTGSTAASVIALGSGGGGGGDGAVSAVANGSNDRVATFSSGDALNGEANLTFNGTDLTLGSGDVIVPDGKQVGATTAKWLFDESNNRIKPFNASTVISLQSRVDNIALAEKVHLEYLDSTTDKPALLINNSDNSADAAAMGFLVGDTGPFYNVFAQSGDKFIISSGSAPLGTGAGDPLFVLQSDKLGGGKLGINLQTLASDDVNSTLTVGHGDLHVGSGSTVGHITASGNISASGTEHIFGGDVTIGTDLTVGDDLTVTDLLTTARFISTGVNSFGNSVDDTHTFAGNVTASGNISASGTLISNEIDVRGHITASGNYSGSADSTFVIGGKLQAGSKSFLINKPEGGKLEYGVLEGQQNDVFFRGELKGDNIIYLPQEWEWLVDENTITTQLTSIGKHQELYFKEIKENKIFIDINGMFKTKENIHCYYVIHGTRKDIELIRNHQ